MTPCTISVCMAWVPAMSSLSVDRRCDDFKPKAGRILSGRIPRVEVRDLDITGGKTLLRDRHKNRTPPCHSFITGIPNKSSRQKHFARVLTASQQKSAAHL